jgi:hypothetical protein
LELLTSSQRRFFLDIGLSYQGNQFGYLICLAVGIYVLAGFSEQENKAILKRVGLWVFMK